MKAILFRQHGGPEVLRHADFPTPKPKDAAAAQERLENGEQFGKITLDIG